MGKAAINVDTGLTEKEEVFVKKFLFFWTRGVNPIQEAGAVAYKDTKAVRRVYSYRVISRERVRSYVSSLLNEAGLTPEEILKCLATIIKAGLEGKAKVKDSITGIQMVLRLYCLDHFRLDN